MALPEQYAAQAKELMEELRGIGDFRRGTVSMFFRKCGKSTCVCASERHPGHPQTKVTVKNGAKTKSRNLPTVDSVRLVEEQIENHDRFVEWRRKWTELNEKISDLRLEETLAFGESPTVSQKKKRWRRSSRRSNGK
jgi:hypothetical protein